MKSFIAAICLGAVLISASAAHLAILESTARGLADAASETADFIEDGDYAAALPRIDNIIRATDKFERVYDMFGNHREIDEVETETARLKTYTAGGQKYDALSSARTLMFLFEHLPKDSRIRLENIF